MTTQRENDLLSIGERLRTQNNRCTESPMFIVQQQRSFGCEPGEGDMDVWLNEDREEVDEETAAKLEGLDDVSEWELEEDQAAMLNRHTKCGIKHFWEFCMAAFTEEGCKRYIELNGHNLTQPRIYAESWNRCPEMLAVREFLMANAEAKAGIQQGGLTPENARNLAFAELERELNEWKQHAWMESDMRKRLQKQIMELVTTDHENKESFIQRVRGILSENDKGMATQPAPQMPEKHK